MTVGEEAVEALKHFFHERETELENHFDETLGKQDMEEQPYSIECDECNADLEIISKRVDSDNDLWIKVEPCEFCLEEASKEASNVTED